MRVVVPGGIELEVHDDGPRGLPAAVVAHGVGSSSRFVRDAFGTALEDAGYRLVTYDLRGHGDSDPVPQRFSHTLDHHAGDLGAVARQVGARLVGGVSLGAHAAVRWAARAEHRLDGVLACLPGWTGSSMRGEGPHAAVAQEVVTIGVSGVLARVQGDPTVPAWLRAVLERDWRTHDPDSLVAALVALDGADAPSEADLAAIDCPVGVVGWPDDPGHPARVAQAWSLMVRQGALRLTDLHAVGDDPSVLGRTALDALDLASNAQP